MHTREGGGIDSQKVTDLVDNRTFQSPLTPGNKGSEGDDGDDEMMGLEDFTIEELEAEFDQFQLARSTDPQHTNGQQVGRAPPPSARLHEVYNLEEIDAIRKGVAPQPVREEPTVYDLAEQPGAWDPTDILRSFQAS